MSLSKETRRTRGEIACAECRRLRVRCNKQVPCSTCIIRGCDILCPNGMMPPGDGSRFVSVAERYLRRKIVKMEERTRLLEDALVIIQGSAPCEPYPQLDEKWPSHEVEWTAEVDRDPIMGNEFEKYGLAAVLGSLYLDKGLPSDQAHFGTSGNSESFDIVQSLLLHAKAFMAESSSPANHAEETDPSFLPSEVNIFYQAFPFTPSGIPTEPAQDLIESYLPPLPRATALSETFLQSTSWMFSIISRQHILDELIPMVYEHASAQTQARLRPYGPHDIALLFIVFAIGALVDPSLPPYNIEGQHYHILSRAAMCLQPVFMQRSVVTIKTLNLMGIYNGMCGIESKLENMFSLMNLAAQVALQTGFYKDPSTWGITGREAYDRRTYFWNLLYGTLWQSLVTGRSPVIMPSLIDCHIPTQEEEDMYQSAGEIPLGFGIWSFSFANECLVPVVEATQGARPPNYDIVLALDHKIREFSVQQEPSSRQMSGKMQAFVRNQLRALTLLFLHRGFFAQALADFPCDPLRSPLRQSFLTAYQSATVVLNGTQKQFADQPTLCARVWRLWSFAFSAAIIIAAVAIKRVSVKLEPEPFGQLDLACTLFREAARTSVRAQKALPILLRLRQEALQVRSETLQYESGKADSPEGDYNWGVRDGCGTFVDSSRLPTHHSTSSMFRSEAPSAPSSKYMQVLVVPVVHPPLAKIDESDEEPCARAVEVPIERQGLYREISSSTSFGSHELPSALYINHPPAYGPASEDQRTSFTQDRTGTHMHANVP